MEITIIFLLSSIVTARLLDKKRMHVASIAYSVMFVIILSVLLFVVDFEFIRRLMINIVDPQTYYKVHFAFMDAINAPFYGLFISGALLLTFVVQLAVTVLYTATVIVFHYLQKNSFTCKKNAYFKLAQSVRSLYLSNRINLLYCRMLN